MSRIFGTCSMKTGHASTHQRHIVHAHRTLSVITPPTSGWAADSCASAPVPPPATSAAPFSNRCSCKFKMSIFGSSCLPLMFAGQREVHRPHSVQL